MDEVRIRPTVAEDIDSVAACVEAAYAVSVERLGRKPAPILVDYGDLIGRGRVWVAAEGGEVRGVLVLLPEPEPEPDHMLVWNVAVDPAFQGRGLGRRLMAFAEAHAAGLGLREVRLFTNELMAENVAFYGRLGYEETERRTEGPYRRVFMRKSLTNGGG